LSVLLALQRELPLERFVYVSDAGHAPYGEKDDHVVLERSRAITRYLREHHHIKALVVACNTATAAAIATLRASHPGLPIVGIEPAVKPAIATSKTGNVAVMATRGTLASQKFKALMGALPHTGHVILQPCDGLADAIERNDARKIEALCADYTRAIGEFGTNPGQFDTLVLGCTHYPFVQSVLRSFTGSAVVFLEGGVPVAKQTRKLLAASELLAFGSALGDIEFLTTGSLVSMQQAIARWLGSTKPVQELTAHQAV
jgi:glutamate racemase